MAQYDKGRDSTGTQARERPRIHPREGTQGSATGCGCQVSGPRCARGGTEMIKRLTTVRMAPADRSKPMRKRYETEKLDDSPVAVFIFKYRTRSQWSCDKYMSWLLKNSYLGALQALMLVDRTPTPVPLNERPVENLSREELMELVQKQRVRADHRGGFSLPASFPH